MVRVGTLGDSLRDDLSSATATNVGSCTTMHCVPALVHPPDHTHAPIHMLRHMSGDFLEKAEFLEIALARAVRLGLVDLSKMSGFDATPDNVIEFPNAFLRELDEE